MSETIEEKAAYEVRRHCELLVENGGGLARTAAEGTALMQADHGPRGGRGGKYGAANAEGEATQRHEAVGVGVTRRGFDAQHKTGGSGRSTLMTSQQVEWTAELQDPEVRAELNRRVRECEWKCFASGRLGSIPQASARARQQATREQIKSQWCASCTGTARRRCDQAQRSCWRLHGCAGRVSAAHAREQRWLSP
jgi:hypothetical protein